MHTHTHVHTHTHTHIHKHTHTVDPQHIRFDCQRLWQPPEFSFNLTWTIPPFIRHGNVITGFVVIPSFRDCADITITPIDNVTIPLPQV